MTRKTEILKGIKLKNKKKSSEVAVCIHFSLRKLFTEIRSISPYSVRMRENADQNNSEHTLFTQRLKPTKVRLQYSKLLMTVRFSVLKVAKCCLVTENKFNDVRKN